MSIFIDLADRSKGKCELCLHTAGLKEFPVAPRNDDSADNMIVLCDTCYTQSIGDQEINPDHWRCLNEAIWNPVPSVQVISYRMLKKLENESWAQDLLAMIYLEDDTREWAEQGLSESHIVHKDNNGNILQAGDTVTLIKDLVVKGANFTAKRGTAVRRISLVHDNANHIEGKVEGQHIVILTQYVKKN